MSKKKAIKTAKKTVSKKKNAAAPAKKGKIKTKAAAPAKKAAKKGISKPVKKHVAAPKKSSGGIKKAAKKSHIKPASKAVKKGAIKPAKKQVKKQVSKPVVKPASKPLSKIAVKKAVISEKHLAPVFPSVKKTILPFPTSKSTQEPKGRFELEYDVHASTSILYDFLTNTNRLAEWFCDQVSMKNGIYTFKWDDTFHNAKLVKAENDYLARFLWIDKNDGTYFEFRIEKDDLTNDVSLIIVDFADSADERISTTLLWDSQIERLFSALGSK
ncbi:MAG: hypothetical protein JST67_09340 [Bacteroidetes bacterium]|nr:hypothetical protein [Bacteroidota bacterium]